MPFSHVTGCHGNCCAPATPGTVESPSAPNRSHDAVRQSCGVLSYSNQGGREVGELAWTPFQWTSKCWPFAFASLDRHCQDLGLHSTCCYLGFIPPKSSSIMSILVQLGSSFRADVMCSHVGSAFLGLCLVLTCHLPLCESCTLG